MRRFIVVFAVIFAFLAAQKCAAQMTGLGFALLNSQFTAGGDGTEAVGGTMKLVGNLGINSITKMTGGGYELGPGVIPSQRTANTGVGDIHVFPVPFLPSRGHRQITFTRLPARATIEIFTVSGELVKKIEHDATGTDRASWYPVVNESGNPVASGVYIWTATDHADKTKVGKLMIIK